jgi:hypothetical protein
MNRLQEGDMEFLETAVLDFDIEASLADDEYDPDSTDVFSDEMLRIIERDFD